MRKSLEQLRDEMNDTSLSLEDRKCSVAEYKTRVVKFCYVCGKEIYTYSMILVDGKKKRPMCGECNRSTQMDGMETPFEVKK